MKAIIISSNGYLDKRIERVLSHNDIKGDITNRLSRSMLNVYDCVIFSHKNEIPNLPKVIEQIVLERKILVLFISNTPSIGQFYTVVNNLFFHIVKESTLDVELPVIIQSSVKYLKKINILEQDNTRIKDKLELVNLTNKAKRCLINKGLSEEESHQFIQRKSMDMRISKKKLVNLIIENKIDI